MAIGLGETMSKRFGTRHKVSPPDERTWNGRLYASKGEMRYAQVLDGEARMGLIVEIFNQPTVQLGPVQYRADWAIRRVKDGPWLWIDYKGVETPTFKQIKKLWREYGPGDLLIVKSSGKNFKVAERVISTKGAA
jgi:hypothetical protein